MSVYLYSFPLFEHEWRTIKQKRLLSLAIVDELLRPEFRIEAINIIFRVSKESHPDGCCSLAPRDNPWHDSRPNFIKSIGTRAKSDNIECQDILKQQAAMSFLLDHWFGKYTYTGWAVNVVQGKGEKEEEKTQSTEADQVVLQRRV